MLTAGSLTNSREFSVTLSRETLVLVAIALLALGTRFAELSVSPLQVRELPAAVAAIYAPTALPVDTTGVSPILRMAHRLLFSLFGAETDSLRLPVALAGVALVLSPQLFRPLLGRAQSLTLSGLLLISPLLLFASRSAESAILAQLAIISMLYAIYQCWLNRNDEESKARHRWQIASAFTLALTVFLTDGRGYLLAGSAILAAFYAIGGGVRLSDESRVLLRDWPWRQSLLVILASLLPLSTALLIQLDGLALVGDNLAAALVGWASPGNFLQIIGVSFYYEHGYWLLAAFALISRWKRGEIPFPERFAAAWLVLLTLALTLDRGTNPAHASWLSIPLAICVLAALKPLFTKTNATNGTTRLLGAHQAAWLVGIPCALLFAWLAVQLRILTAHMDLYSTLGDFFSGIFNQSSSVAIWTVLRLVVGLFMLLALYLGAQIYIERSIVRRVIGATVACFLLAGTFSNGWRAVTAHDNVNRAPWLSFAQTKANHYFAQSLAAISHQLSANVPEFTIALALEDEENLAQVNTLLWNLRKFEDVVVLPTLELAAGFPVVISDSVDGNIAESALAGPYYGQRFVLSRQQHVGGSDIDILRYFLRRDEPRQTDTSDTAALDIILWVSSSAFSNDYSLE